MNSQALAALQTVRDRARSAESRDRARLEAAHPGASVEQLTAAVRRTGRLTLNFHPDRLTAERESVAAGLLRTGRYLTQRQTGLSNGMRFAPGGDRSRWEAELFADAYLNPAQADAIVGPVYGALDIVNDPFGGAPRFGSSFVVLGPHCFDRATFCVGDSHLGPTDVGTIDGFAAILAGLFETTEYRSELVAVLDSGSTRSVPSRELDDYVEVQVHGGISLESDVAAIVLDPSFRGTPVESDLLAASDTYNLDLEWHEGSAIAAEDVPADFRGDTMPALAAHCAGDGRVDAAAIGRSLAAVPFTPPAPGGDPADGPLQQHKYLWHCLLKYGSAAAI